MAKPWIRLTLTLATILVCSSGVFAQTEAAPAKKAPAAPAGPAPTHDLWGVWNSSNPPEIRRFIGNTWSKDPAPLTEWGQAKFKEAKASNGGDYTLDQTNDPVISKCFPPGTPRIYMQPFPMQMLEIPGQVIMLYEYDHTVRHIYTDGREHPKDVTPTYMGHSIGHWENDTTLVVDTVGFNDSTWLDRVGHPHSDQLHVTERFQRTDKANMKIDVTMEDPKALTKPWTSTLYYRVHPDWDILEQVCTDNGNFVTFEKAK